MGALDAFYSTWSDARETFGQGAPQDGGRLDNSSQLMQMKAGVEAAAPDGRWQGPASEAYAAKNKEHAGVYGKLAELDTKMATEVTNASNVVTQGRQSLENTKSWVDSAVKALPSGLSASDRDNKLLSIANQGIGQVSSIVTEATNKMTEISGRVQGIKGEYQAIGSAPGKPKEGPGIQMLGNEKKDGDGKDGKKDGEENKKDGTEDGNALKDGKPSPEALARLQQATSLTPEQIKAWEAGKLELPKSQLDYLNSLARSMDDMNIHEVRTMMDELDKTNPGASKNLMNGLQMLSDPKVQAPGGDMKGDLDRLPTGIKNVADGLPSDLGNIHGEDRRDLAAIMMKGSQEFLHGSDLDRSVLKQTEQILKGAPDWTYKQGWELTANPALKDMLAAAGRDHWAVHDLVAGADGKSPNNEFISNLLRHNWDDGGASAATLLHGLAPIATDATQPDAATRAGETVFAFDKYIADHGTQFTDMTSLLPKDQWNGNGPTYLDHQMFGKADPELVRALSEANRPFLDDMVGHNLDHSRGFGKLEDGIGGDANMPHTRDLLGILASDPEAAKTLHKAVNDYNLGYQNQFVNSINDHGIPDVEALKAASKLQGLDAVASAMAHSQQGALDYAQAKEIWDEKGAAFDAISEAGSIVPGVDEILNGFGQVPGGSELLKDMFVGEEPTPGIEQHIPVISSDATSYSIAQQLFAKEYGNTNLFPNGFPSYGDFKDNPEIRNSINTYLGEKVVGNLNTAYQAYQSTLPHDPPKFGDS